MKHLALLGALVLTLSTCARPRNDMAKTTTPNTLTDAANGKTLEAKTGDVILVRLPENATTGYRWAVDAMDETKLELVKSEYVREGKAIGSGGEMTWTLKAKSKGSSTLKLKLWRSFEGDKSIQQRFVVTFKIL